MAKQAINTDRISSAANKLRAANNNINNEFRSLQSKAKQLDASWKSAAGETAQTTMAQLFKSNDQRSKVLQNYVNLLEQQINPGYTEAEKVNTTLAEQFK